MSYIDIDARTNPFVKAAQAYMKDESKTQDPTQYKLPTLVEIKKDANS